MPKWKSYEYNFSILYLSNLRTPPSPTHDHFRTIRTIPDEFYLHFLPIDTPSSIDGDTAFEYEISIEYEYTVATDTTISTPNTLFQCSGTYIGPKVMVDTTRIAPQTTRIRTQSHTW